jgi:hypothetical protein
MVPVDLHVIGATTDGKLWHTMRFEEPEAGRRWQDLGDVKVQTGDVGAFVDVDCAREFVEPLDPQGILHVVGVTSDGRLWYTARDPVTHGWKPFRDGELSADGPGPFLRAAVTAAPQADRVELVVAGVTADGGLWATTRKPEGGFNPFARVAPPPSSDRTCRTAALAAASGATAATHLAAVSGDGHLWHTMGRPGQWPALQDVERSGAGGQPRDVTDVACADDLDLVAVAGDGHVWHTTRDGTAWTQFTDPEARKDVGTFTRIGVSNIQSGLHICGVTGDGGLWHTLRIGQAEADARAVFGNVRAVAHAPSAVGPFQAVACS